MLCLTDYKHILLNTVKATYSMADVDAFTL